MTTEEPQNKKLTTEGIEKILEFLLKFQDKEFNSGKWHLPERIDGVTSGFPYYECSPLVGKFLGTLSDEGFAYPCKWVNWDHGVKLSRTPELLQKANLLTLRKLMFAHLRYHRFCEGHLAAIFAADGLVVRLLERLQQLSRNGVG